MIHATCIYMYNGHYCIKMCCIWNQKVPLIIFIYNPKGQFIVDFMLANLKFCVLQILWSFGQGLWPTCICCALFNSLNVCCRNYRSFKHKHLKVLGPISQNGDFYSIDVSSLQKSWFQISVKSFGYKKGLRILLLPIPYCISLNIVTITSHIFVRSSN